MLQQSSFRYGLCPATAKFAFSSLLALSGASLPATANLLISDDHLLLPYMLSFESMGLSYGVAGAKKQTATDAAFFGTAMGSENDSSVLAFGVYDFPLQGTERWRLDTLFYATRYTEDRLYLHSGTGPQTEQPVLDDSQSLWLDVNFKYRLPIGDGIHQLYREAGANLRQPGKRRFNPLEQGLTTLTLNPFYESRELEQYQSLQQGEQVLGLKLKLDYDNRDWHLDPHQGTRTQLILGMAPSLQDQVSWSQWSFSHSYYSHLGSSAWFEDQVLALQGWIASTPSWNDTETIDGQLVARRPPVFARHSLGGFERMRGLAFDRYHGRSAVAYSAELRLRPQWQPLSQLPLIKLFEPNGWQWVLFTEAGNVSNQSDWSALHQDMKYSAGGGIRVMAHDMVLRLDLATGTDGGQIWAMIGQAY